MASTVRGFAIRAVDMAHGYADPGVSQISFGKALPQTNTISLFTVSGSIVCSLVGVVSTVFGVAALHMSLGVTGTSSAIAAPSSGSLTGTAVGSVFSPPQALGAALPAPSTASAHPASCALMEVSNTIITATADVSTTGAVTWILTWVPLFPKSGASVTTN